MYMYMYMYIPLCVLTLLYWYQTHGCTRGQRTLGEGQDDEQNNVPQDTLSLWECRVNGTHTSYQHSKHRGTRDKGIHMYMYMFCDLLLMQIS